MRKKHVLAHMAAPLLDAIARRRRRDRILALVYHRVYDDDQGRLWSDPGLHSANARGFREQMAWLARHFSPIVLDEVPAVLSGKLRTPRPPVLVTFDDGNRDNHEIVLPILRETGMRASFFVTAGLVGSGQPFWFDFLYMVCRFLPEGEWELPGLDGPRRVPSEDDLEGRFALRTEWVMRCFRLPADEVDRIVRLAHERFVRFVPDEVLDFNRPMNWGEVQALAEAGMGIGAHSMRHPLISRCDPERRLAELRDSRRQLEARLGCRVRAFAWPVGKKMAIPEDATRLCRRAGLEQAYTYEPGVIRRDSDPGLLPRMPVERWHDLAWLRAAMALPEVFDA